MPRSAALLALLVSLPATAQAYDTQITAPLHEPRSGLVVGSIEAATPSTLRFRDSTHAAVTFSTSTVDIRGEIALDEGEVRITSTQHIVLTGSPFRIEVEPATALHLVDGLRHEVTLPDGLPVDGLDLTTTHLRVASEETLPVRDAALLQACQPVHLWAAPRTHGPVIRTVARGAFMHAPVEGVPGWTEVWLTGHGVWLRGYTWEAMRCGGGYGLITGASLGLAVPGVPEMRTLLPNEHIASSARAPWTVQVREIVRVAIVRNTSHAYFVFPLTEGLARIEGVVLP